MNYFMKLVTQSIQDKNNPYSKKPNYIFSFKDSMTDPKLKNGMELIVNGDTRATIYFTESLMIKLNEKLDFIN